MNVVSTAGHRRVLVVAVPLVLSLACAAPSGEEVASESAEELVAPSDGATVKLKNACSGLMLDVSSASKLDGAGVLQWSDTGGLNQRWKLKAAGDAFSLLAVHSGKALDAQAGLTSSGTAVLQWALWGGANQQWRITANGNGTHSLSPAHAQRMVLAVSNSSRFPGTRVQLSEPTGGCAEQWTLLRGSAEQPAPTPAPAPAPAAPSMPVGDLPGWQQIFAEDFSADAALGAFPGTAYKSRFTVYPDGWLDTSKQVTYMPSKTVSVANGMLDIFAHTEGTTRMCAVIVPTIPSYGQLYGRYSVRFRADAIPGYGGVWLLWPDDNIWPAHGEIDYPEGGFEGSMHAYAHYASPNYGQDAFNTGTSFNDWHVVTTEWSPGKVTFLLDGKTVGTSTTLVPSSKMHYLFQCGSPGGLPPATAAGHIQVDWIVMYARAE